MSIGKIALALSKVQAEMRGAKKDSKNPFFKSSYADLESVWEACRELLSKNELSVAQTMSVVDGKNALTTILMHSSGESISGTQLINSKADDPQANGSAITYARRYGLAAIVGVIQVDDDGEAASGRESNDGKAAEVSATASEQPVGSSSAPMCCGKSMSISNFPDKKLGPVNPWYCFSCKAKVARV